HLRTRRRSRVSSGRNTMTQLTHRAAATATTERDLLAGIELVVLDMAGTTVRDDGIVERTFERTAERTGVADRMPWEEALAYVRATMGQSKLDVFTHLSGGDLDAARVAADTFETAYAELLSEEGVQEIPGARRTIEELRDSGRRV